MNYPPIVIYEDADEPVFVSADDEKLPPAASTTIILCLSLSLWAVVVVAVWELCP